MDVSVCVVCVCVCVRERMNVWVCVCVVCVCYERENECVGLCMCSVCVMRERMNVWVCVCVVCVLYEASSLRTTNEYVVAHIRLIPPGVLRVRSARILHTTPFSYHELNCLSSLSCRLLIALYMNMPLLTTFHFHPSLFSSLSSTVLSSANLPHVLHIFIYFRSYL